jgi:hypothetical protein
LAYGAGTPLRVDIPELHISGHVFYPDFSLHFGSHLPQPDNSKLSFGALVLEIDHAAGFQLDADTLQRGAASADGPEAGGLSEGTGVGIHTPDLDRKLDENALLAAAIHDADTSLVKDFRDGKGQGRGNTGNRRHRTEVPEVSGNAGYSDSAGGRIYRSLNLRPQSRALETNAGSYE